MIIAKHTDLENGQVAVPASNYRFSDACALCNRPKERVFPLTFRTHSLGSVTVLHVPVPLCEEHWVAFSRRRFQYGLLMAVLFAAGVAIVFGSGLANTAFSLLTIPQMAGGAIGTLFVAASIWIMKIKNNVCGLNVKAKAICLAKPNDALVFRFQSSSAAKRFHDANDFVEQDGVPTTVASQGILEFRKPDEDLGPFPWRGILVGVCLSAILLLIAYALKYGWL